MLESPGKALVLWFINFSGSRECFLIVRSFYNSLPFSKTFVWFVVKIRDMSTLQTRRIQLVISHTKSSINALRSSLTYFISDRWRLMVDVVWDVIIWIGRVYVDLNLAPLQPCLISILIWVTFKGKWTEWTLELNKNFPRSRKIYKSRTFKREHRIFP